MDRDMGLYDSATGESLDADVVQRINESIELWYCKSQRGPIVQIRHGCLHVHYFYREDVGQRMIREDERRNGVSLDDILAAAPAN